MEQDDQEGVRNLDDDNFIDDTGIDPADRYGDDYGPRSPGDAPQVRISDFSFQCTLNILFSLVFI